MIENIIGCAEKEDTKALTGLFSQYAGDSTLNLTEQAEEFIEFFQGECKSWKGNASSHEKSGFLWSLEQKPGIYVTEDKEEMLSEQSLITPEELIRAAGLTKEQYRGVDLEQFIEDFAITEEDVDTLNIPLLLEEYEPERKFGMYDVSYLLEDDIEERTSDFTENVYAIAFMENRNTSTECVYYDILDSKRYQTSDAYLFDDLYQTQAGYYADGQQIVEALDKYGVFGWESGTGEEEITDPQYMVLAVEYDDGTVFRVKASGLLSQVLPDEYDEVREMLLSGEHSGS